jgi:hypothetical protein
MKKQLLAGTCMVLGMLFATSASAQQYVWLNKDASGAVIAQSGALHQAVLPVAPLTSPKAVANTKALPVQTEAERFVIQGAAANDVRFSATEIRDGVLIYHHARFGRQDVTAVNDLELVPTTPNGSVFKLMWKGNAIAATQVNVATSDGWYRTLTPAADGAITMDTPFPGLYVMDITVRVNNGNATIDGKKYDDVRYSATLSFEVPK